MRLLMAVTYVGGAGGVERAVHSHSSALREHDLEIVYGRRLGGSFSRVDPRTRLYPSSHWRWRGCVATGRVSGPAARRAVNPLRRRLLSRYDAYLAFSPYAPPLGATVRAGVRMLIPAGSHTDQAREDFDVVAMEAPDNGPLLREQDRRLLLTPPVAPLAEDVDDRNDPRLPEEFFFTVFNPYSAVKGADQLREALDRLPLPVVWCFSRATLDFPIPTWAEDSAKVVLVEDATPQRIRALYQRCTAYLGFSTREGFGWSLADALLDAPAVVSRPVGILSYPQARQPGVFEVLSADTWEFDFSRLSPAAPGDRDLSWASAETYPGRLQDALSRMRPG